MSAKTCILCRTGPRELPDRERPGMMVKLVCRECHRRRLKEDLRGVLRQSCSGVVDQHTSATPRTRA